MRTRLATVEDSAALARLYVTTRRIAYAQFYPAEALAAMSVEENEVRWRVRIGDPAWETVVGVDGEGAIAGLVHFGRGDGMEDGVGEIEFLYVGTEYQGSGLGTKLIGVGEAGLRARGCETAVLWVYEGNVAARGFYARRGWAADGVVRVSDSVPGQMVLRYAKALDP
jgi:ribosomal protein S18 acetylase RimI-like enzyme